MQYLLTLIRNFSQIDKGAPQQIMSTYNTEARQKLLAFLAAHRERAYTVPELVENLRGAISSSTIYRLVKALVLEEIKEHPLNHLAGVIDRRQIARPQAAVNLN